MLIQLNTRRFLILIAIIFSAIFPAQKKISDTISLKNFLDKSYFYSITADTVISKDKILMLRYYDIPSMNPGQSLITYDFCDSVNECQNIVNKNISENKIQSFEMTGVLLDNNKFWIHPPRSKNFRILEMNAFPYVEMNKAKWNYELDFGNHWGDKKWIEWEGRRKSQSEYSAISDSKTLKIGSAEFEYLEVQSNTTIPELGNTKSIFYFDRKNGFLKMIFNTIDGKDIIFDLIKISEDK